MKTVAALGEILLRLSPPGHERFVQAGSFCAQYGGSEANVAVSLAGFGMNAILVSKVPEHALGQAAVNALRRYGVDTRYIFRGGDRLGVYYLEKGASQRPSDVIYDRAGSAVAEAKIEEFDWQELLAQADWFHFTGITAGLGGSLPQICLDACKIAKQKGIPVSCDFNYRAKLWTKEQAGKTMRELLPYVDVAIGLGIPEAEEILGLPVPGGEIEERLIALADILREEFGIARMALTLREAESAEINRISGVLISNQKAHWSKKYEMQIVDRVGGGDGFTAGLLYAMGTGKTEAEAIEFAMAAGCLKHTIEGDFNLVREEEVENLIRSTGFASVKR